MKSGVFESNGREAAVQYICSLTEIDLATATAVLCARDLYRVAVGVDGPSVLDDERLTATLRTKYPTLFPADVVRCAYVSPKLERQFVMLESGADEPTVRRVLGAERNYYAERRKVTG